MKRPEGFDKPGQRTGAGRSARPARGEREGRADAARTRLVGAPTSKPDRGPDAAPSPAPASRPLRLGTVELPRREHRERAAIRADREARARLRRAARERRLFERAEVRRFTARSRRRRAGWITAGAVVAVLAAMLAIAVFSPILSLRTVEVRGAERVSPDAVEAAIADQLGAPLALLDMDRIADELGEFPLIRSFATETVPPDTLVIRIIEREPVAIVPGGEGWNLVDPAGVVVQSLPARPPGVPRLYLPNDSVDTEAFSAAIGVLLGLPEQLRSRVGWLRATTSDDVTFGLPDVGQRVYWGSAEDNDYKARVLGALIEAQKKGSKVQYNVASPGSPFVTEIAH